MPKIERRLITRTAWIVIGTLLLSGCAYYNTFYNIKKDFRAAERQTKRAQQGAPRGSQPGGGSATGIPVQQYQGILQSCSKLLEFYPNSRWIDDALMVMGVSYYRTEEFARAERKFTELGTIFPNSRHAEEAVVWRAQALLAQNMSEAAENVLLGAQDNLKTTPAIAGAARTLAKIAAERKQPEQAVEYLERIREISYDRDEKASDFLTLGRSYHILNRRDEARTALERCLGLTRSADEAFEARSLLAQMAALDKNYDLARDYLRPLEFDRRFIDRAPDVRLEAAKVEAEAGDPSLAIRMMEEFCSTSNPGEAKARSYYLQGLVARNKLGDLELARAKFDSVPGAGAPRALQDSARNEARQLESGLDALQHIPILRDSLAILDQALQDLPSEDAPNEDLPETVSDSLLPVADSVHSGIVLPDTVVLVEEAIADVLVELSDSVAGDAGLDTVSTPPSAEKEITEMTPAEMLADSIMRALTVQDSLRQAARAARAPDTVRVGDEQAEAPNRPRVVSPRELYTMQRLSAARRLVAAHLDAASFYETVLSAPDSAMTQLESGVAVAGAGDEHWRAVVQLGLKLINANADETRGTALLHEAAEAEEALLHVRNAARDALGLAPLQAPKTDQDLEFDRVERGFLAGDPLEEVVNGYRAVAALDSHSAAGARALHALAYLLEFRLARYPEALAIHTDIVRMFPDSGFTAVSRVKLTDPDTSSIFLLSDEALQAQMVPAFEILRAESDSSGWPPEESSLRGRRFE